MGREARRVLGKVPARLADDHRGAVVGDDRLAEALGVGVAPVGGCEFYDSNEGEGLNDAGEIHCLRVVDVSDPDPGRHATWRGKWGPRSTK